MKLTKSLIFILVASLLVGAPAMAQSVAKRKVSLEWEPVEDATGYEVKIIRILKGEQRKKPIIFKLDEAKWTATVKPGQYEMQLRSKDVRGVPGEWSNPSLFWVKIPSPEPIYPTKNAKVKAKDDDEAEIELKWKAITGAEKYRIEVQSEDGSFKESYTTDELSKEVDLQVARKYLWRVTALMPEGSEGEVKEELDLFAVIGERLDKPKIDTPPTKFVEDLTWDIPDHVQYYDYLIQKRVKSKKWKTIQKVTKFKGEKIPFDLANPSGKYRLVLKAKAKLRVSSEVTRKEFDIIGGLRNPASIEAAKLKESIEKPSTFYGIASYFITQVSYSSVINNNRGNFDAVGGTGRLGLGYQKPKSSWGGFGIIDLGGFIIGKDNYTFSSVELHATWKKYFGAKQLQVSGGIYNKELPALEGSEVSGFSEVKIFNQKGPHVGFKYWSPINYRYGIQVNGRLYYGLSGEPGIDAEYEPSLSYQFGLLGSLRWAHNIMCYAGYAYRLDNGSFTQPGSTTGGGIELQGHYLNLLMEYSF